MSSRYLDMLIDVPAKEAKEAKEAPLNSLNSLISQSRTLDELLTAACEKACHGLDNMTAKDVLAALAPEDVKELEGMADPLPFLLSFALALSATRWRRDGIAPTGWTSPAHCDRCGPVFLWAPIHIAGCPWCWNRRHGLPIPRPPLQPAR